MSGFPGAHADRADAEYVVVGAPLDRSTTYQPGTRFGPRRIRAVAESFEDYDHHTGSRFTALGVHDHGDVRPGGDVEEYLIYLEGVLSDVDRDGSIPVLLGGEHTVTVAAVRALDPDVFVCLDAHLDLREAFGGDPYSHSTVTRHALEVAEEAIILGARAGSEREWQRAAEADVTVVPPEEVSEWSPAFEREVYLSVDIDAADPGFAPGTGTLEPFGLDPTAMREVVRAVAPHAVGADVVEVNDQDDDQAAVLGAKLVRAFVFAHADAAPA
ncbi:agmatinase [Halapricum hydrolyticum]|uniref:Agmatinase n=1 Tax=Halapricum hydrolyticum TaxID=2979991 RepID=A0AAE3LEC1_9EURY|nr:agmatinase [Halapricum hydrolyticum]MCU4717240.1 agmatinase [Halapricum hydrolyticum]MCU4726167.1 agmatinase [Halapricum hydrolyticum]